MRSWRTLQSQSFWHKQISFDERAMCLAADDPWEGRNFPRDGPISNGYTCKRASGSFIVGGFRLHPMSRHWRNAELESMRDVAIKSDADAADMVPLGQ
jgi:hypothetical protein